MAASAVVEYSLRGGYGSLRVDWSLRLDREGRVCAVMPTNAKDHYNHVTDSWKEFMGDNLHFGYFETEDMELPRAT
jgi:hypothetical protein